MYLPPSFEESRPDVLRDLMTRHPLATVVTLGADGLDANHLPLLHQADPAPHRHYHLAGIKKRIAQSALSPEGKARASALFDRLAPEVWAA